MRKTILSIFLVLVLFSISWAGMVIGSGVASSGSSYLVEQNFEGTGYDNSETWTETGSGTMNEDYTTTVLAGSQSLYVSASSQAPLISHTFSSTQTEVWGYFLFRPVSTIATGKEIITIKDASGNSSYTIEWVSTGKWIVRINGSGASSYTTNAMSEGTTYHCWWHVKNGNGTAVCSFGFGTTGTEVTSGDGFVSKTNGTEEDNLATVCIGWAGNATATFITDKFLCSATGTLGNQ